MNLKLYSWWIVIGSASFYIFVICWIILTILYVSMYFIVRKCIKAKNSIKISKERLVEINLAFLPIVFNCFCFRIILLRKSLYIFHALILVILSSILYINIIENIMCHFVFSITSSCLVSFQNQLWKYKIIACVSLLLQGVILLFCYALKFDHILEQYFLRKLSLKTNEDSKKRSICCMCPR